MTSFGYSLELTFQLQPDFKQILERADQICHMLFISMQEAETNNSFLKPPTVCGGIKANFKTYPFQSLHLVINKTIVSKIYLRNNFSLTS